jgi:polyphosphate kinase 2 (PPK2 family)
MSTRFIAPVLGRDYAVRANGSFVIARHDPHMIIGDYKSEPIPNFLGEVNHKLRLGKKEYRRLLDEEEAAFKDLVFNHLVGSKRFLIVVLQGHDGAGKTGARVRLEEALKYNAKVFMPIPIGAPTSTELAHGYLWRFFTGERMPEFGQVRAFDRSWAERMLVERVEKLAPRDELNRSYAEINGFEWMLTRMGGIVVKFWMDITKKEQDNRFEDRRRDSPEKMSKADGRAQEMRQHYIKAANEMFYRNGTDFAPWNIVSSEDKKYSRVAVLQIVNEEMRRTFGVK